MFSDLVDGASGVAFVGRVLSGSSCVSWIPSDPLVELYHWLQGGGAGGPMTPRWQLVYAPGQPAVLQLLSFHIVDVRSAPSTDGQQRQR